MPLLNVDIPMVGKTENKTEIKTWLGILEMYKR